VHRIFFLFALVAFVITLAQIDNGTVLSMIGWGLVGVILTTMGLLLEADPEADK
jgi:hypothetical protein